MKPVLSTTKDIKHIILLKIGMKVPYNIIYGGGVSLSSSETVKYRLKEHQSIHLNNFIYSSLP